MSSALSNLATVTTCLCRFGPAFNLRFRGATGACLQAVHQSTRNAFVIALFSSSDNCSRHLNSSVKAWSTNASASSAWGGVFEALDGAMRFHKDELLQRKVPLLSKVSLDLVSLGI